MDRAAAVPPRSEVPAVAIVPVDEDVLDVLLGVAVADAEPIDVMPPVAGPPGWTDAARAAFAAHHRSRRPGLAGPHAEVTWAILADGAVVGSARLHRVGPGCLEMGVWLGRSARAHGVGTALVPLLVAEAGRLGATTVIAETTADNVGALATLRRNGALLTDHPGGHVRAELPVPPVGPLPPGG